MKKLGNVAIIPNQKGLANKIFERDEEGRYDRWIALKKKLESQGYTVKTIDQYDNYKEVDVVIVLFNFVFSFRYLFDIIKKNPNVKILYHMFEPGIVEPLNNKALIKNWSIFDIIYTHIDDFVDGKKFRKMNMQNHSDIYAVDPFPFTKKKQLCVMNSFLNARYPFNKGIVDLYQERMRVINHFAKDDAIDIYGFKWDKATDPKIKRNYHGVVNFKFDVLKKYKYVLCFENEGNVKGYISEKIFDCFRAGVVPIYLGASNIEDHIPTNCYIDFRKYTDLDKLQKKLRSITKKEYDQYLANAQKYVKSDQYYLFSQAHVVDRLSADIAEVLKRKEKKDFLKIKYQLIKTMVLHPRISYHPKKRGFVFFTLIKW